jgi:hypothetical protein
MSRGRTAAIAAALIAITLLLGACGSGSSKSSPAENDRRAAALIKATAAHKRALAVKRKAVAAKRHAKRTAKLRSITRTIIETPASTSAANDVSAIQRTVNSLNAAFRAGVAAGIANSEIANHWVGGGVYTGDQCAAFETARGQGIVSEMLVVHPESLTPAPGWVDPVIGRVPSGRIYQMAIDETQTLVTTGQQRLRTLPIHVTVKPDGAARLVLRCA